MFFLDKVPLHCDAPRLAAEIVEVKMETACYSKTLVITINQDGHKLMSMHTIAVQI